MKYYQEITLKNGIKCVLRNGTEQDGSATLDSFKLTHAETDFLLTYPDENTMDVADESSFLNEKTESENEIEIVAVVNDKIVGSAGIESVGNKSKVRHRAEYGIGIEKAYWGLGIGKALTQACIDCAKAAGYSQLELSVVAENKSAVGLYQQFGFIEFGRNPKGFYSRSGKYQEVISMRLEL